MVIINHELNINYEVFKKFYFIVKWTLSKNIKSNNFDWILTTEITYDVCQKELENDFSNLKQIKQK